MDARVTEQPRLLRDWAEEQCLARLGLRSRTGSDRSETEGHSPVVLGCRFSRDARQDRKPEERRTKTTGGQRGKESVSRASRLGWAP